MEDVRGRGLAGKDEPELPASRMLYFASACNEVAGNNDAEKDTAEESDKQEPTARSGRRAGVSS